MTITIERRVQDTKFGGAYWATVEQCHNFVTATLICQRDYANDVCRIKRVDATGTLYFYL